MVRVRFAHLTHERAVYRCHHSPFSSNLRRTDIMLDNSFGSERHYQLPRSAAGRDDYFEPSVLVLLAVLGTNTNERMPRLGNSDIIKGVKKESRGVNRQRIILLPTLLDKLYIFARAFTQLLSSHFRSPMTPVDHHFHRIIYSSFTLIFQH